MDYCVGDRIVYGTQGICEIKEISPLTLGDEEKNYYFLSPLSDPRCVIYVPCDNQFLLDQMKDILSPDEIDSIITSPEIGTMEWIGIDIRRKEYCTAVLKSGDRHELLRVIYMLRTKREEFRSMKKHFHVADERFLRDAERIINQEFSYSLGIHASEVEDYILSKLKYK